MSAPDERGAAAGAAAEKLAHDLRSPLAVVAGFAELLASEREFPLGERREFAERIAAAAEEIRALLPRPEGD